VNIIKPIRNPDIIARQIDNETLLYTPDRGNIYKLNPTARLIWELCDGAHSLQEIEQTLRASFAVGSEHEVMADIQHTLKLFADRGLLLPSPEL
jgi:hypothetical protein